jgi:hypothetical protein
LLEETIMEEGFDKLVERVQSSLKNRTAMV